MYPLNYFGWHIGANIPKITIVSKQVSKTIKKARKQKAEG